MFHLLAVFSVAWGAWLSAAVPAEPATPIFYLPLDGSTTAAVSGGEPTARLAGPGDPLLVVAGVAEPRFSPGRVGQCCEITVSPLVYSARGNFRPDEGTCSFWISPRFRGDDTDIYCTFFGAEEWGMLYKYVRHTLLSFGTVKPEGDFYYDCSAAGLGEWRPGQWYHVAVTWSRQHNARCIYMDGAPAAQAPFPHHRAFEDGPLFIGSGCLLYPNYVAHAALDEVAIWDKPLDEAAVARIHELGRQGRPICAVPDRRASAVAERMMLVEPRAPAPPEPAEAPLTVGDELTLDGWWVFLPGARPQAQLPAEGWGRARVPGYFARPGDATTPDGKPANGRWDGRSLREYVVATYQRRVRVPDRWRGKTICLGFDGLDGLADVYVNGRHVDKLSCWEDEDYVVTDLVEPGSDAVVTIVLYANDSNRLSGIYGSIRLRALPAAFVRDVVARPRVESGQIEFSSDVWCERPCQGRVVFEVADAARPDHVVKRFVHPCRLNGRPGKSREVTAEAERVECAFPWPDAHPWTYDDPWLYVVRAKLYEGDDCTHQTRAYRFGFREFTQRGHQFFLNGVPTHLRGHQIDLAWPNQLQWVKDIRDAGMNCFELSGPVSSTWYRGSPYQADLFEDILSYADEHGLIALPILPAARLLKDSIFDAEVARLYRRRIDKHVRRYGNHASIGMWYMNFNLAGYAWYHPPTKIDGSYKPDDAAWRQKERYSLEAQRIAQTVDPRPIYHHACGNLGDIYSLNCYIGPTSPLQEREGWPSRWAAKRPFPLVACEHGLWLLPYWYRPRQFPLSVVYAGEPIFDELAAMMLGPRAYRMLTPEVFDLYADENYWRRRAALVNGHSGYLAVKALIGRHSLRAWRTYGVSGIIFNAIQWDLRDGAGQPTLVMDVLRRCFNHTDFYIAGPDGDFPSKDHSFSAGERVHKQVVLLNDLTRDVVDTLRWQLTDAEGKALAEGELEAAFRAGTPTFVPLSFAAPVVDGRTDFTLCVRSTLEPERQDAIDVQVFPPAAKAAVGGRVLLYDPSGDTARVLEQAGVAFAALGPDSRLDQAALVIVGRKGWDDAFISLAGRVGLEDAVDKGLNLLVFEQTCAELLGLRLTERSTRRAFLAGPRHPALAGLDDADFINLRGASDVIDPYPEAPPETQGKWPTRYFKWGNRGVVATFVYTKPHHVPYVPVLHSGFDLVESPLLAARFGRGRVVLCQVDVTPRYGADPVSTRLVNNLLAHLTSAADAPTTGRLIPVQTAVQQYGLKLAPARFFKGTLTDHPLLAGLHDGDVYMKQWHEQPVAVEANGWRVIAEPGLVAVKDAADGPLVVCTLAPETLGETRARPKALRVRTILQANLGRPRPERERFISAPTPAYEANPWEEMPGYINW